MATSSTFASVGGKRNVIVLGRTGCGKSTLANKIIDKSEDDETFIAHSSLESGTTKTTSSIEFVEIDKKIYSITMIDTVGFCGQKAKGIMSDKKIIQDIKKHLRDRAIEGVSLIIFVFRNGRFSVEEKKVFDIITSNFKDYIKSLSCLVITGCEQLDESNRSDIISEFKSSEITKDFAAIMTKGIFTVGFPKVSKFKEKTKELLKEDMKEDIAPIHKLIVDSKEMHLHDEIHNDRFWSNCTVL